MIPRRMSKYRNEEEFSERTPSQMDRDIAQAKKDLEKVALLDEQLKKIDLLLQKKGMVPKNWSWAKEISANFQKDMRRVPRRRRTKAERFERKIPRFPHAVKKLKPVSRLMLQTAASSTKRKSYSPHGNKSTLKPLQKTEKPLLVMDFRCGPDRLFQVPIWDKEVDLAEIARKTLQLEKGNLAACRYASKVHWDS